MGRGAETAAYRLKGFGLFAKIADLIAGNDRARAVPSYAIILCQTKNKYSYGSCKTLVWNRMDLNGSPTAQFWTVSRLRERLSLITADKHLYIDNVNNSPGVLAYRPHPLSPADVSNSRQYLLALFTKTI